MMTWVEPSILNPLLSSLAAFLVCASGNIVNDIVDIDIDRINKPHRVLVQKKVSITEAKVISIILNISVLVVALFVNLDLLIIASLAISLLYLYNYKAKRYPFVGNLLIALLSGMVFLTGGLSIDRVLTFTFPGPLVGALFAFLFHLVREIVKDIEDVDGDMQAGIKTLPLVIGERHSVLTAIGIYFLMIICTYIPVLKDWYGDWYKIITVYIVDLPILGFLIFLWGNPTQAMLRAASLILKIGMGLGIVALILA